MKNDANFNFDSIYPGLKKKGKELLDQIKNPKDILEVMEFIREKCRNGNNDTSKNIVSKNPNNLRKKFVSHLLAKANKEKTIDDYCREVDRFLDYLRENKINLADLDITVIEDYLAIQRKKRNLEVNSYSRVVTILRVFLKFIIDEKYTDIDVSKLEVPSKVTPLKEYLKEKDVEKIIDYLSIGEERYKNENLRDRVVIYLGISCGLRKDEFRKLNWEDIDLENRAIKLINSKGGKSRIVEFSQSLGKLLTEYRKKFGFYRGAVIRGVQDNKRICATSLQNTVRKIFKKSKVYRKGLCINSMRHTFGTMVNRKAGIATASKVMGHSRSDTTESYLHINKDDLKNAIIELPLP